jgi:ABC-type transport system involved in Fe-S cluster assembly fused permease/ATPase subunit
MNSKTRFSSQVRIQILSVWHSFDGTLVAHRLRTVIDYDRLLVLDQGRIVEFDTPYNLINKENGVFRSMCLNSGTFQELETIATAKHK